jgi:KDO2-lipid IV(A) lauroyltransferase
MVVMSEFSKKYVRPVQKRIKSIRRKIQWCLLLCLIIVTRRLVVCLPEAFAYRMGDILAGIWYRCAKKNRMRSEQNLKTAFPHWRPEERKRTAQAVFQHLSRSAIELFRFYGGKYELQNYIYFHNLDRLRRALDMGKGVIVISAHLGNWELLACAASAMGFPMRVVANRIRNPQIDRLLNRSRAAAGVATIFRDESIVRMLRLLRDKKVLAILMDQDSHYDGIFVNHFDKPTYAARGPAILTLASGAPIIPVFIAREADGHHSIYVEEPVAVNASGDREQKIKHITQCCMDVVEHYIRQFPDQWVWMHQRWKTRPKHLLQPEPLD